MFTWVVTAVALALPMFCGADLNAVGNCDLIPPWNNEDVATTANYDTIAGWGDFAIVAMDASSDDDGITCAKMKLDMAAGTYNVTYTASDGSAVADNGILSEGSKLNVLGRYTSKFYNLEDWNQGNVLGDGSLYIQYVTSKAAVFKSCKGKFSFPPSYDYATYLAVPLEEAKENAACNCDWAAV